MKKGVFEKGWKIKDLDQWLGNRKINNAAISTTAGIQKTIEREFKKRYNYIRLTHTTALPINNKYQSPETLGKDRLSDRLDRKGDRIDRRLDRKGDRVDRRLDRRGDQVDRRLDRKGQRIDRRLDNRGDRISKRRSK